MADADELIDDIELDTEGDAQDLDEAEPKPDTPGPQLIDGKFKTVDDVVEAYRQSESKMHTTATVRARMEKQLQEWGCTVDPDTGDIQLPDNTTEQTQQSATPTEDAPDPNQAIVDRLLTDPIGLLSDFTNAQRTMQKQAESNVKRVTAKLKSDPLFAKVKDDFDAEISAVEDRFLVNPQQAEQVVNNIYERAVGRFAREQVKATREDSDPAARTRILESLGLGQAEPTGEPTRTLVTQADREMLSSLGITDPKEQDAAIKAAKQRTKEERNG